MTTTEVTVNPKVPRKVMKAIRLMAKMRVRDHFNLRKVDYGTIVYIPQLEQEDLFEMNKIFSKHAFNCENIYKEAVTEEFHRYFNTVFKPRMAAIGKFFTLQPFKYDHIMNTQKYIVTLDLEAAKAAGYEIINKSPLILRRDSDNRTKIFIMRNAGEWKEEAIYWEEVELNETEKYLRDLRAALK